MDTLNTVIFYIFSAICLSSGLFCLFCKETFKVVISASAFCFGVFGLYILLRAPYHACVQILLWGAMVGILAIFTLMMINKYNDENPDIAAPKRNFTLKAIMAPVLAFIFAIIFIPFILYQFGGINTLQKHDIQSFATLLFKNNSFAFELTGILVFCTVSGICAILTTKILKIKSLIPGKKPADKEKGGNQYA